MVRHHRTENTTERLVNINASDANRTRNEADNLYSETCGTHREKGYTATNNINLIYDRRYIKNYSYICILFSN